MLTQGLTTLIDYAHLHGLRYNLPIICLYTVVEMGHCILLPVPQSGFGIFDCCEVGYWNARANLVTPGLRYRSTQLPSYGYCWNPHDTACISWVYGIEFVMYQKWLYSGRLQAVNLLMSLIFLPLLCFSFTAIMALGPGLAMGHPFSLPLVSPSLQRHLQARHSLGSSEIRSSTAGETGDWGPGWDSE